MDKIGDVWSSLVEGIKKIRIKMAVAAVIMIAAGIILLIWPVAALEIVCRILGVVLAITGLASIVLYLVHRNNNPFAPIGLIGGSVIGVLGLWLFLNPSYLIALVPTIIGIIIIITGVNDITEAFGYRETNKNGFLVGLILGIVTLLLGILIFLHPTFLAAFIVQVIALVLIFDGVTDIVIMSRFAAAAKVIDAYAPIDAEAEEVAEAAPTPQKEKEHKNPFRGRKYHEAPRTEEVKNEDDTESKVIEETAKQVNNEETQETVIGVVKEMVDEEAVIDASYVSESADVIYNAVVGDEPAEDAAIEAPAEVVDEPADEEDVIGE